MRRPIKYALISTAIVMFALIVVVKAFVGYNSMFTWQYVQKLNGDTFVQNDIGWFWKGLASCTTYPDVLEVYGTKASIPDSPGDDSARSSFNDGGWADCDWYARIELPKPTLKPEETAEQRQATEQMQREFHRRYRSKEGAVAAVRAHARDCIGKTGNIMSASENQASRKAEFYQVAYGQFSDGYYQMRAVTIRRKSIKDLISTVEAGAAVQADNNGQAATTPKPADKPATPVVSIAQAGTEVVAEEGIEASETVRAAEVVYDASGKPVITTESPFKALGCKVVQFSISETEYDPGTMEKFAQKRKLLLETETARALSVQKAQERLMNIADANKSIAETEAQANQEKTRKVIAAQILQEVEGINKKKKEVEGQTKVLVAEVMGKQLEAERQKSVFDAQAAENQRMAAEITAEAQEQMIALGGAASEAEKTLQEIYTAKIEAAAKGLPELQVPDTVVIAMDAVPEGKSPLEMALPSLQFIRSAGLMEPLTDKVETKWEALKVGEMPKIELAPATSPVKVEGQDLGPKPAEPPPAKSAEATEPPPAEPKP